MDNTATESSITCPHYKLEIVYLKPELVAAFEKLDRRLTYDFKIIGKCLHQGEPDGRFLVLPNEKKVDITSLDIQEISLADSRL